MATEKRELLLDLLSRDKTGPATKSAGRNFDALGDAVDDAATATDRLGAASDGAEDQVQRFGKSSRTAAEHVEDLDREIENVERELRQLAVAWKEAESAAEKADLSKAIRRTQRDLRELNKNKGLLSALIPDASAIASQAGKVGESAGSSFVDGFGKIATKAGPLGAVGAGIGLAMAPMLGATIAGGLLGGAAGGGVLGGLALAARDSRVKSAAKGLGDEISKTLGESADAFVPAALDGLDELRAGFRRMSGDLNSIFDSSARYVRPLAAGLSGLIERAVDGAEKAIRGARPVIDALERNLPRVGDALGDVLESLADNGPTAAVAFNQLFDAIEGGIHTVGFLINGLTETYGLLAQTGMLGGDARNAWIAYDVAAQGAAGTSRDLAVGMNAVTTEAEDQVHALTELSETLRAQTDPVFGMLRAQRELAEANKATTESAKEHGKQSPEYQEALRKEAEAALALESAAGEVAMTSDGKMTPALKATLRAAGMTEGEIRDLAGQFATAKRQGDAFAKTYNAKVEVNTKQAREAKRLYDAFRNKQITVDMFVRQHASNKVYQQGGDRMFRAEGGPVQKGVPYIVGEKRPEVFVPSVGAFMTGGRAPSGRASSGGGEQWVAIRGDAVLDALIQALATRVSARGGRAAQLGIRFS